MNDYAKYATRLGFTCKTKIFDEITEGSFLKGSWWPLTRHEEGFRYAWAPLISNILKLGKVLRDPCGCLKEKDPKVATLAMAKVLSLGTAWFPRLPLVRAFYQTLTTLTEATPRPKMTLTELYPYSLKYQPPLQLYNTLSFDMDEAYLIIEKRYGLTLEHINEIEYMFSQVHSLPAIVAHPGLIRLLDVDYA
jgi:hypothetical protein